MRHLNGLSIALALPIFFFLWGCASTERQSDEARQRAMGEMMVTSAQQFTDKLNAQSEAYIADYKNRFETYKPSLRQYVICNKAAAKVVALQTGDPVSLALAARSLCREDETKLQRAIYAAYTDNPNFGVEALDKIRQSALERNTGDIVAFRAQPKSDSVPPRPAAPPPVDRRI